MPEESSGFRSLRAPQYAELDPPAGEEALMKKKTYLRTEIEVDEKGTVVALYFYIRSGKAAETREFADGKALADYDRKGNLLGIELLGPCEVAILDKISRKEPAPVKKFLRGSIPRDMALA